MPPSNPKNQKTDVIVGIASLFVGLFVIFSITRDQGLFEMPERDDGRPGAPTKPTKKEGGKALNDPSLPAYVNKAYALFVEGASDETDGDYKTAMGLYQKAIELDPIRKMYWSALGNAYMHENEFDKSVDAFKQVYNRDIYDTFNLANLGYANQNLRRDKDSLRYYLMALTVQPDLQGSWAELYNVAHGLVLPGYYDRIREMSQMPASPNNVDLIADLNDLALSWEPNDYYLLMNRAMLNLRAMRLTDAKTDIDKALAIDPKGPAALIARAQMYNYMGEFDKAAESYKACLAVSEQPVAYAELGTIEMQQGKINDALHHYGKATELGNDKPSWVATYNKLRIMKQQREAGAIAQDKSGVK